jgi:hypothetical protein
MEIYAPPTFQIACRQFDIVADRLQIPGKERERLTRHLTWEMIPFIRPQVGVLVSCAFEAKRQRGLFP